jgi:dihydrofolate synthase/folylpolyglutamate synthase
MSHPQNLQEWLAHCERLHAAMIDLTLERVQAVRGRMALAFDVPLFAVAGTNGKGSTCAMLEAILRQAGYRVGVYTSPHLVYFEERCRVNGKAVAAEALIDDFEAVEAARDGVALTYFEFTTLAVARHLSRAQLDVVVLEVGLGGRLDAVNAFDADCAIITSIDLDHMAFLGGDRESIGREKAGIMRTGRPAIVVDPHPPASVIDHAREIDADLWCLGRDFNYRDDQQQWSWNGRGRRLNALVQPALRGAHQLLNAAGVLAGLESVRERLPVSVQAVRAGLAAVALPGRFQVLAGQPAIVLDVAHNPHAASTLARNLDQMGFYPRTHAVFGAMADKDLEGLLRPLVPLVDAWHLCALPTPRAASPTAIGEVLRRLPRAHPTPAPVHAHATPHEALCEAMGDADPADRIVVFGSFYTVGGVMKDGVPRLAARHLS